MLLDTSVIVRLRDQTGIGHSECSDLIRALAKDRRGAVVAAQVLIEYWVVATRPPGMNGLGLEPAEADKDIARLLTVVPCLPEPPDVFERWRRLVVTTSTRGRPAHDARLVAVLDAHRMSDLVTLNPTHFARFPHVRCLSPAAVLAS